MSGLTVVTPVTFTYAIKSQRILPGDELILSDGVYSGDWLASPVTINGTLDNPIVIRPQNPGMVTIDGQITVLGKHVHIYDINLIDSNSDRHALTNGVYCATEGFGLFGCIVSDQHSPGVEWHGSGIGEVSECIILNNGDIFPDESYHGHGLYTHNNQGGERLISKNMIFDQFGDYGLHIYSDGNALKDYTVEDNVLFGQPTHIGGPGALSNFVYRRNIQYADFANIGRYTNDGQNVNGEISSNIFIGLSSYSVNSVSNNEWLNLIETDNVVFGGQPSSRAGYTYQEPPATWSRVTLFTRSARWLAGVTIYNRDGSALVDVDFSAVAVGNYKLRNAQNPAETWNFTANGIVSVPMNIWTTAQRIGDSTPPTTFPQFGAFVLERA